MAAVVNGHDFFHQRRGERIITDEVTTGHTADYGLMMFNPFGNPGADPIRLAENETLTLQYRANVHAGDEPDIAGQYRRYATP